MIQKLCMICVALLLSATTTLADSTAAPDARPAVLKKTQRQIRAEKESYDHNIAFWESVAEGDVVAMETLAAMIAKLKAMELEGHAATDRDALVEKYEAMIANRKKAKRDAAEFAFDLRLAKKRHCTIWPIIH